MSTSINNIGLIGIGYWGPNLYRNFSGNKSFSIKYICDINSQNLNNINTNSVNIIKVNDYKEILKDKTINSIVISTPVKTHYKIAMDCLNAGKNIFVEKPLADSSKKCEKLIEIAKKNFLTIFVDHTFLYTSAVNKMKEISLKSDFGKLLYYDSTRINLGLIQNDINVIWDLAVHDLAILKYIYNKKPILISAIGHKSFSSKPITSAYLTLKYEDNFVAHINVNWLSPVKIRKTILGGSKKMILYNDLEPSDKITVFNKGIDVIKNQKSSANLVKYKVGDTYLPYLDNKEALSSAVVEFDKSIKNKNYNSKTSATEALEIVKMLEAADKSMSMNGKPVKL